MAGTIPEVRDNPGGLHRRYAVTKADGSPTDPLATYFVLRLDSHGSDGRHIRACRAAARQYAETILNDADAEDLHRMANELKTMVDNLERENG